MTLFDRLWGVFKGGSKEKEGESSPASLEPQKSSKAPAADEQETPPDILSGKGIPAFFYRKWKDPAFLKQMRVLASHMQKDGVDVKSMSAVKAWLEKNKEAIESGKMENRAEESVSPEAPYVKSGPSISRNDPCPCGSGKKYKKCCAAKAGRP